MQHLAQGSEKHSAHDDFSIHFEPTMDLEIAIDAILCLSQKINRHCDAQLFFMSLGYLTIELLKIITLARL